MAYRLNKAYELISFKNGYIKKYEDGTAEYHENIFLENIDVKEPNGNIYYSIGGVELGNFISRFFKVPPYVMVNISYSSNIIWNYSMRYISNENKGTIYFASSLARSAINVTLDYHAYGKWK